MRMDGAVVSYTNSADGAPDGSHFTKSGNWISQVRITWRRDIIFLPCICFRRTLSREGKVSNTGYLGRLLYFAVFSSMVLVAACGGDSNGESGAPDEEVSVDVRLDWLAEGPNSGFVVADAKGFYADEGLDVTIEQGEGSGTTAQLVANRSATFGFADGYVVAQNRAQGAPIKMVAAIYRENPTGVIVLDESEIQEPIDLVGKSVGITPGGAQGQQWPAYLKGCEISEDDVRVVNVDPAGAPQALLAGRVDAIAGYVQGFAPVVEKGGKETRALWFRDCEVTAVSNGIIVHEDYIDESPDVIERFVKATTRGFVYGRANPDETIDIITEFNTELDPDIAMAQFELSWETYFSPETEGQPLGWMSEQDWSDMLDVVQEYGGVSEVPPLDDLFTNEFVPEGDEFVPEGT